MRKTGLIALGFLIVIGAVFFYLFPYKIAEKSPFNDIEFENNKVFVSIGDTDYEWLSAEGISVEEIQSFAQKKYADKWQHRISDNYILLMKDMGHWTFFSTKLQLQDEDGNSVEKSFPLSEENRKLLRVNEGFNQSINRKHSTQIPDSLKYITQRMDGYTPTKDVQKVKQADFEYNYELPMNSWVPRDLAIADLQQLEYQLQNNYAYADLKDVNYPLVIDAIIADLQNGISKRDLGVQIKRLLALFGDGHSRISRSKLKIDSLFLPFKIKKIGDKYYAVSNGKLFNAKYPEIVSIDGFSMPFLQNKAGEMASKGTAQLYNNGSLEYLSYYGFLQQQLNIKNNSLKIKFTNEKDTILKSVKLIDTEAVNKLYADKKSEHKVLKNNIGYLYLHKMEKTEDYQKWLQKAMEEFKDTRGLIIDIRGNGGGSRKPTYTLLPYFLKSPKVININALRINLDLDPDINEPVGGLEKRMAYPEKSQHWTESERKTIADFKAGFTPEWKFDKSKFSKWHYSVVSPNNKYYDKPVVVLMNGKNFSATDIFLAAFKGTKNITLIGQKSSGGSGFVRLQFLQNAGLYYLLSRMVSFQPNGKLYDGNGIIPDIEIKESINNIGKDVELKRATEIIMKQ